MKEKLEARNRISAKPFIISFVLKNIENYTEKDGYKAEKLLQKYVPKELIYKSDIENWLKLNWNKYN